MAPLRAWPRNSANRRRAPQDTRRSRPRQAEPKPEPVRGLRGQLPREVDGEVERRQEPRQVAQPEAQLGVRRACRGEECVPWIWQMVNEVSPEDPAVQAERERQLPDQRQAALGEQEAVEVVPEGEEGAPRPGIVGLAQRVEAVPLIREGLHPEVD